MITNPFNIQWLLNTAYAPMTPEDWVEPVFIPFPFLEPPPPPVGGDAQIIIDMTPSLKAIEIWRHPPYLIDQILDVP